MAWDAMDQIVVRTPTSTCTTETRIFRMNHPKSIKFLGGSSFDPHAFLHGSRWLSSPIHGHLPSQRLVGSHFLLHLFQSGPRFINLPRRGIGIHQGGEGEGLDVRGWGVQAVGE